MSLQVERLVEENIRLVHYIVRKFRFPESEFDDLVSVGSIGLIKAARTYDVNKRC
jgi:RNA polymerase sporulation-specific sigma factor